MSAEATGRPQRRDPWHACIEVLIGEWVLQISWRSFLLIGVVALLGCALSPVDAAGCAGLSPPVFVLCTLPALMLAIVMHELGHALAVWCLGGRVVSIRIDVIQGLTTFRTQGLQAYERLLIAL